MGQVVGVGSVGQYLNRVIIGGGIEIARGKYKARTGNLFDLFQQQMR